MVLQFEAFEQACCASFDQSEPGLVVCSELRLAVGQLQESSGSNIRFMMNPGSKVRKLCTKTHNVGGVLAVIWQKDQNRVPSLDCTISFSSTLCILFTSSVSNLGATEFIRATISADLPASPRICANVQAGFLEGFVSIKRWRRHSKVELAAIVFKIWLHV